MAFTGAAAAKTTATATAAAALKRLLDLDGNRAPERKKPSGRPKKHLTQEEAVGAKAASDRARYLKKKYGKPSGRLQFVIYQPEQLPPVQQEKGGGDSISRLNLRDQIDPEYEAAITLQSLQSGIDIGQADKIAYQYLPLPSRAGEASHKFSIRLLHLLPSTDPKAALQCHLIETEISDPQSKYHALSYTWGDAVSKSTLEVVQHADGDQSVSAGSIKITENLHSALLSLRGSDSTLALWVDAICIDQGNILERNSQVKNMSKIYTEAHSVIVWLGSESVQEDGRLCFRFFSELTDLIIGGHESKQPADLSSWRRRFDINQKVSAFLDGMPSNPVAYLLERPWFRRRWIIQEVVLAKNVVVHCGEWSIPWTVFEHALIELFENDKGRFTGDHRTTMRTMTLMRHADADAKRRFPLDTLVEFSCFVCADPRDRLYALYGVIQHWFPEPRNWANMQTGSVNYALSTEDVFTDFTIMMLQLQLDDKKATRTSYKSLTHVLQLAAAFQQNLPLGSLQVSDKLCRKMPSWVVDWTGILSFQPLCHSPEDRDASSGIPRCRVKILPPKDDMRLLVTTGLAYDFIVANVSLDINPLLLVGAVHEAKRALNNFLCRVVRAMDETVFACGEDNNSYMPTEQHIVAAISIALVANWEHKPANSYFAQHPRFPIDFLQQLASINHHLPEILHKWPAYVELVAITMRGRGLFLTASGYVGICAANVRIGDVVCILSDIRIPLVLRPHGGRTASMKNGLVDVPGCHQFKNDDQYSEVTSMLTDHPSAHTTFQLMGDAYVHGLMKGEGPKKLGSRLYDALMILPIA